MGKQLEIGTQFPMRPSSAVIAMTAGSVTPPRDTPPVDWTVAGTKLPLGTVISEFMDDKASIILDAANDVVTLRPGIWEIEYMIRVTNTDAANDENARLAITNLAGSTVHRETPDQLISKATGTLLTLRHLLHLTATDSVAFRIAQTTDTGGANDLRVGIQGAVGAADPCIKVTKVGNANES